MSRRYTISELAREFQIPMSTLRFYHRSGLFVPAYRDESNGYHYYSADQVSSLDLLTLLRELDMPINDIRDILNTSRQGSDVVERLTLHRKTLQRQIENLTYQMEKIQNIESAYARYTSLVVNEGEIHIRPFGPRIFVLNEQQDRFLPREDGEWRLLIRTKMGFPGPELPLPKALQGMGTIASLRDFRSEGEVCYHAVFLEPFEAFSNAAVPTRTNPPGDYLVLRYNNRTLKRLDAYRMMSDHIREHGLDTEDSIYDVAADCVIPPVNAENAHYELHIRLR